MIKVVLDTNVFVSSLLVAAGLPAQILDAWRERQFLLIICPAIIAEVRDTMDYPRIRRKYPITDDDVARWVTLLERDALVVSGDVTVVAGAVPDDPSDEMVLACAVEVEADVIVSGDRHLLDVGSYQSIPILTAREFLSSLFSDPAPP